MEVGEVAEGEAAGSRQLMVDEEEHSRRFGG